MLADLCFFMWLPLLLMFCSNHMFDIRSVCGFYITIASVVSCYSLLQVGMSLHLLLSLFTSWRYNVFCSLATVELCLDHVYCASDVCGVCISMTGAEIYLMNIHVCLYLLPVLFIMIMSGCLCKLSFILYRVHACTLLYCVDTTYK